MIIFLFALPILILLLSMGVHFDIPLFVSGFGFILTMALYCVAPSVYFALSDSLINKANGRLSKRGTVLLVTSFILYISSEIVFFSISFGSSRVMSFYLAQRIVWCVLWCIVATTNGIVKRRCDARIFEAVIVVEGVAALLINAFIVVLARPLAPSSIDGFDAVLLIGGAFVLSVAMLNVGRQLSGKHRVIKVCLWFVGILASFFAELCLVGTPHMLPTVNMRYIVPWIALSVITFAWFLAGIALNAIKKSRAGIC